MKLKWGKKKKNKRNPKRNPQNKTANDNPDDDFPFSNVFGSVCLYFAGSAAFGGQKIRRQLTTAAATPTAATATATAATATLATATSLHRHRHNSNNFSFRFSRGACQKKKEATKLQKIMDRESNRRNRYENYAKWLVSSQFLC